MYDGEEPLCSGSRFGGVRWSVFFHRVHVGKDLSIVEPDSGALRGRNDTGWNDRPNSGALERPRRHPVDGCQGAHNPKVVGSNPTPATI